MRQSIDTSFDFTSDTPGFWEDFWRRNQGLGAGGNDPDACSETLKIFHEILWSKALPNGEKMNLTMGAGRDYLTWKDFRFGSDSITASFRYLKYRPMLEQVEAAVPDYKSFVESYLRKAYTIGGAIIFPKRIGGINQARGCNPFIKDRWDLTLECIRRYYLGEKSPLYDTLVEDKAFFDLFVNFQGYVDFFFLQDCVSDDYSSVVFWQGDGTFTYNPLPRTVEEYLCWIKKTLGFVEARNNRIDVAMRK